MKTSDMVLAFLEGEKVADLFPTDRLHTNIIGIGIQKTCVQTKRSSRMDYR